MARLKKLLIVILVITIQILVIHIKDIQARPGKLFPSTTSKPTGCVLNPDTEELCQQCAKHTKSNVVYPLCCNDEEDAQDFCNRYLNFGLH